MYCVCDYDEVVLRLSMNKLIIIINFYAIVQGSYVRDAHFDKNKIAENYCPKSEHCEEGSHVMCMYYNPRERMSKQCHDSKDIQITPPEAEKLMDIANMIRGNVARGKETGRGEELLPRAYGMYRLEWDEELATFAQVLANSCLLKHDLCRATSKYPDPGQTTGVVRFSYPDWYSIGGTDVFPPGLSEEKLLYSIRHIMRSWYDQKIYVTPEMVNQYPNWPDHIDKVAGKLYLEMIAGEATHMGCGISAYAEYAYHANNADLSYNNVHVVCNYSAKPRKGEQLYNTKPPTENDVGYTVRCGCPVGYDEDYNCLCYQTNRSFSNICEGDKCKPSVVLLPIFTVEDAPAHKMIHKGSENQTLKYYDSFELLDQFDKMGKSRKAFDLSRTETPFITERSFTPKRFDVRRRYFGKPLNVSRSGRIIVPSKVKKFNKQSIFTRTPVFVLPTKKTSIKSTVTIKKDVVPRKDFTQVKKLVTTYLTRRRNGNNDIDYLNNSIHETTTEKFTTIDVHFDGYLKDHTFVNINKENDEDKLINLLDNLQEEVKHIGFDRKEKEIFNAKLRSIFNSLDINSKMTKLNNHSLQENHDPFDRYSRYIENNNRFDINEDRINKNSLFNYPIKQKDKNKALERKYRHMYGIRRKNKDVYRRNGDIRRNFYLREDSVGDLSHDRRKFYQDKLDNLERQLQSMGHGYQRQNAVKDDRLRPVIPSTTVDNSFYLPDRARFLHGF
ncbi:unnamed protein product [Pieris brassicae]|uniref:SCP domain-containing protein n=1 Tax=Pieris brassicae TaxID=7116 RepID=A0A9P0TVL8_PIEBR|nr:unnamed protein product [Pieris brassicae]